MFCPGAGAEVRRIQKRCAHKPDSMNHERVLQHPTDVLEAKQCLMNPHLKNHCSGNQCSNQRRGIKRFPEVSSAPWCKQCPASPTAPSASLLLGNHPGTSNALTYLDGLPPTMHLRLHLSVCGAYSSTGLQSMTDVFTSYAAVTMHRMSAVSAAPVNANDVESTQHDPSSVRAFFF